ncbi:MAG: hypothetical protein IJ724_02870 [Muribaculaceae bacterium]|nr:hypothetical protein [Muribaculaceae bacterium]
MANYLTEITRSALIDRCVLASSLRGYKATESRRRQALAAAGGFCVVIPMKRAGSDRFTKSLRVWYNEVDARNEALMNNTRGLSRAITQLNLKYFINYEFFEEAIQVQLNDGTKGPLLPGLVIDWLSTGSLGDYLMGYSAITKEQVSKPTREQYETMRQNLIEMSRVMEQEGISHGDLSPGNVMVTENYDLQLIDYDSMMIPAMGVIQPLGIIGTDGYKHPGRTGRRTMQDDRFAYQVLHLMLLTYARHPELNTHQQGEEVVLFTQNDLATVGQLQDSARYKQIKSLHDQELDYWLRALVTALNAPLADVKPLHQLADEHAGNGGKEKGNGAGKGDNGVSSLLGALKKSKMRQAKYCPACGHMYVEGRDVMFCTECGNQRLSDYFTLPSGMTVPPGVQPLRTRFCPECGNRLTNLDAAFCTGCGSPRAIYLNQ